MSTPMFHTGRRKIAPPFGGFTPAWGGNFSWAYSFVYAAQILRWPQLAMSRGKRDNFRSQSQLFGLKNSSLSACVKLPKIGCNPYLDTVENGSTLGKPDIHGPQPDPKAQNLTPNFWDFDP